MPDRRILVFDEAGALPPLVEQALVGFRFEIVACRAVDRLAQLISDRLPCLLLLAVEAPKRTGFTAFTRARMACKRPLPTILCSASLPRSELDVHAKQRWHASAYLEASDLTPESLRKAVSSQVRLGSRKAAAEGAVRRPRARGRAPRRVASAEAAEQRDDHWIAQLLSDIDHDATVAASTTSHGADSHPTAASQALQITEASDARHGGLPSEEQWGQALQELAQLRAELASAQRYVSTSPFSDAFLELRGLLETREAETRSLRRELAEGRKALQAQERRTRRLAERLLSAERHAAEVRAGQDAHTSAVEELRRNQEHERRQAQASLEREQQRHRDALERVRTEQRAALEALRQRAASDAASLQDQARAAQQASEQRYAAELATLRSAHAQEISGLRKRFEEQREAERQEFEAELQTLEALLDLEREERPRASSTTATDKTPTRPPR